MSAVTETRVPIGVEVAEQFVNARQQRDTSKLGLWVFLLTELLLFSGLFVSALVIRVMYPDSVTRVALHLKFWIGAINTVILITSSFCMSGAIEASRLGLQRWVVRFLLATASLGAGFLVLKGFEYYQDWDEHMMPFLPSRPYVLADDPHTRLFTDLYYVTTGLHAVHLTVGIGLICTMAWLAGQAGFLARHQNRIEISGLYWHFIDLVWIIAFPALYVLNR